MPLSLDCWQKAILELLSRLSHFLEPSSSIPIILARSVVQSRWPIITGFDQRTKESRDGWGWKVPLQIVLPHHLKGAEPTRAGCSKPCCDKCNWPPQLNQQKFGTSSYVSKNGDSITHPGDLFQCLTTPVLKKKIFYMFLLFTASSVTLNSLKHKRETEHASWQIWESIAIEKASAIRSGRSKWLFHNLNNIYLNFSGNTKC